jgi:hypothetical protein
MLSGESGVGVGVPERALKAGFHWRAICARYRAHVLRLGHVLQSWPICNSVHEIESEP